MTRSLALTVSLFLVVAAPALAQTHPPSHAQGRQHDAGEHTALDPSQHAAMHALLGNWTGTSSSLDGVARKLDLTVASDNLGNPTLKMNIEQLVRVGAASHVAIEDGTLHWTQDFSGTSCKASAVVSTATSLVPETMKGNIACEHGEIAFALQKTKG